MLDNHQNSAAGSEISFLLFQSEAGPQRRPTLRILGEWSLVMLKIRTWKLERLATIVGRIFQAFSDFKFLIMIN